ncbi:hypothetical protein [Vibrio sagamiensis]|uniref:Uncharacterized protein n=1 Tax=Vibrio sagamiensis NBRC 104589 TaxID=1219064 RepID=A0A511QLX0_9VIBR|nr:hypothetical protein [Vibrio sagamiensis]PNQ54572.1 hypothetical protein C1141_15195 [Vibrio agarivorans]GEM77512.1 hypothetical protein VSA01S_36240 [Vibrio sagamiensis NBRC 104589]
MKFVPIDSISKTLEGSKAIQLHRMRFQHLLANIPKSDPLHDELNQLINLSDKFKNLEVSVGIADAQTIHQFNALSDQLSSKLNEMRF